MALLISFDIDGTLEFGDPTGSITMDLVRRVIENGNVVGSCSDRPISYQKLLWQRQNIGVDFTALKDRLEDVKAKFQADEYYHIGDTDMDEFFAVKAGFQFIRVDSMAYHEWSERVVL